MTYRILALSAYLLFMSVFSMIPSSSRSISLLEPLSVLEFLQERDWIFNHAHGFIELMRILFDEFAAVELHQWYRMIRLVRYDVLRNV